MEPVETKVEEKPKNLCPECGKDMSIRPGAVYTCDRPVCLYWRIGFNAVD